jgi:hypothetical protein
MAITQAIANSFKKELLDGDMSFKQTGGDTFKIALYISTATLNSTLLTIQVIVQVVKSETLVNMFKVEEL